MNRHLVHIGAYRAGIITTLVVLDSLHEYGIGYVPEMNLTLILVIAEAPLSLKVVDRSIVLANVHDVGLRGEVGDLQATCIFVHFLFQLRKRLKKKTCDCWSKFTCWMGFPTPRSRT